MNKYLDIAPEVAEALAAGKPVVALESTIISHGMPYPQNVETALKVEEIIRANGAIPATIAILGGSLVLGFIQIVTGQIVSFVGKAKSGHLMDGIWELRPGNNRVFYFCWRGDRFVLLRQFRKKSQKTPRREIERAKAERDDWLARKGE